MTPEQIQLLKQRIDAKVRVRCTDGEVLVIKIDLVDDLDGEIVYEMLSTNRQAKYEKFDVQPAYLIRFAEIESVEAID